MAKTKFFIWFIGLVSISVVIIFLISYFHNAKKAVETSLNNGSTKSAILLEIPSKIRVGEQDKIVLKMGLEDSFFQSSFSPPLNLEDGDEPYFITVESRLEMNGLSYIPPALVSANIKPGNELTFTWALTPNQKGEYSGMLWLWIILHPKNLNDSAMKNLILAKPIKITATSFLGLPVWVVRGIVIILCVIALGLVLRWREHPSTIKYPDLLL